VKAADAYAELRRLGRPVLSTREAAALWGSEQTAASRRLASLADAGLVLRIRKGLWALDSEIEPFALGPYLTAPLPSYVSLWSALADHGMIEQVPRQISLISLARPRRIVTTLGTYIVHQLTSELFGGYTDTERGYLASAEKALFDLVYVRSAAGTRAHPPELSLPEDFDRAKLDPWIDRIESPRLQTLVKRRLRDLLDRSVHPARG
jgi:predicted transcriptional regulator of viral defense system